MNMRSDAEVYFAPRTCRIVRENDDQQEMGENLSLGDFADVGAYVLIAEPGAGKTSEFQLEAAKQDALFVTVRDFLTFDKSEWLGRTLFLDGLDESRVGGIDGRGPLDRIREKIDKLGRPHFRVSCRWSFWFASNDREHLSRVSCDGELRVIRLQSLSENAIKEILAKNHGVASPEKFIEDAKERGVYRLLENPQNLMLFASAVAGGNWPDSRRETFEQACGILAKEPNHEHRIAGQSSNEFASSLDIAGRLCAIQVLSGNLGYTLSDRAEPDMDFPSYIEIARDSLDEIRRILGTRLFTGAAEGKLQPVHRQIAEFLASRYVATVIRNGLPLKRVLALITGFDGELMPQFSNFVSWLGVHSKRSRKVLSRLNPSGLVHMAEPEMYSSEEKKDMVINLRREWVRNPSCFRGLRRSSGIGRIVSPELESMFREILSNLDRSHEQQSYVMDILQMLADGTPLLELSDVLNTIVVDSSRSHGVRCWALDVLIEYMRTGGLDSTLLVTSLHEIHDGTVEDPSDELMGILLEGLYPAVISMEEAKRYLRKPKQREVSSAYTRFWKYHVLKESTWEQLAELMDSIAANIDEYKDFLDGERAIDTGMWELPFKVLNEILSPFHSDAQPVSIHRLYEWLEVIANTDISSKEQKSSRLRWEFESDPRKLKELMAYAIESSTTNNLNRENPTHVFLLGLRSYGYICWCLEQSVVAEEPSIAEEYVRELVSCFSDGIGTDRLSVEEARTALSAKGPLLNQFDELMDTREWTTRAEVAKQSPSADEEDINSRETTEDVETRQVSLGVTPLELHHAAVAYLGLLSEFSGESSYDRVMVHEGGDKERVDLIIEMFEQAVRREDLPHFEEVLSSIDQDKVEISVLPFTAGLHHLEQDGRLSIEELSTAGIFLAVTLLHALLNKCFAPDIAVRSDRFRPKWFLNLLETRLETVADVMYRTSMLKLSSGVQPVIELRELATETDYRDVATIVSLRVLKEFPALNTDELKLAFCWVIIAALESCNWDDLVLLIRERIVRSDITDVERSCLGVAGYFISPSDFGETIDALRNEEELKWLVRLISVAKFNKEFAKRLDASDIPPLVELVGRAIDIFGLSEETYWWVSDLILKLGSTQSEVAGEHLEEMAKSHRTAFCSDSIARARENWLRKRREQKFRYCTTSEVADTLDNRRPANVADLAALTTDELTQLSACVRQGATSDWRQYWNVDEHNRPDNPKPENACRDAILSDLNMRLENRGIDAQAESTYADDARADIRVSYSDTSIPIEIKRSCHPALWTAISEQLIEKYTTDPKADGFGIYVVFWFGNTEKCPPTRLDGWFPQTAEDLKCRLKESLSPSERNTISVCVIDVSIPHEKTRR